MKLARSIEGGAAIALVGVFGLTACGSEPHDLAVVQQDLAQLQSALGSENVQPEALARAVEYTAQVQAASDRLALDLEGADVDLETQLNAWLWAEAGYQAAYETLVEALETNSDAAVVPLLTEKSLAAELGLEEARLRASETYCALVDGVGVHGIPEMLRLAPERANCP